MKKFIMILIPRPLVAGRFIIILLGLLLLFNCASMQKVPPEETQLQKIYELQGMTKYVIFDRILAWIAETCISSKSFVEFKDKENGKIIGKGVTSFLSGNGRGGIVEIPCRYTMIIDIKDNKIRLTYKNFIAMYGKNYRTIYRTRPAQYKIEIEPVKKKLTVLSDNLYNSLSKK